jgi:phosphate transport system permease protein
VREMSKTFSLFFIGERKVKFSSGDFFFKTLVTGCAIIILIYASLLLAELFSGSKLSFERFGISFIFGSSWDPVNGEYGALPFIFGTLVSSLLALAIAVPVSLGISIYLAELSPRALRAPISVILELLAAIPSVIIGLWGIFVLAPFIRDAGNILENLFGFLPIFRGPSYGLSMLTGGVILAIMIIPIISSVSREALSSVPQGIKEAALALGATRWEMIKMSMLPYARSGLLGAIILGLGRAMGETMAITMVIGNVPRISPSLLAPSYTMSAVIANEFAEAHDYLHESALIEIGLILCFTTLVVNALARALIWKIRARGGYP